MHWYDHKRSTSFLQNEKKEENYFHHFKDEQVKNSHRINCSRGSLIGNKNSKCSFWTKGNTTIKEQHNILFQEKDRCFIVENFF